MNNYGKNGARLFVHFDAVKKGQGLTFTDIKMNKCTDEVGTCELGTKNEGKTRLSAALKNGCRLVSGAESQYLTKCL